MRITETAQGHQRLPWVLRFAELQEESARLTEASSRLQEEVHRWRRSQHLDRTITAMVYHSQVLFETDAIITEYTGISKINGQHFSWGWCTHTPLEPRNAILTPLEAPTCSWKGTYPSSLQVAIVDLFLRPLCIHWQPGPSTRWFRCLRLVVAACLQPGDRTRGSS